ncbi:MAG: tetratricopeptide repeat protein [Bacteroidetes bacterium]|nr:tetratricopeptide repeat protein [Bacteroidota bacterium]MDA0907019.1 tetratricopeptide repeat protein [Bacteroidota bacterium]
MKLGTPFIVQTLVGFTSALALLLLVFGPLGLLHGQSSPLTPWVQPEKEANELYNDGTYDQAAEAYRGLLQRQPAEQDKPNQTLPKLWFNLGNSLAQLGDTEKAIESYDAFKESGLSQSFDPTELSKADYNKGTLLAQQDPEAAIDALKQALKANPQDPDAKHNLEMLLQQQQQNQQQNNQNQDQDQNQDQNQNSEQNENQDQQDQNSDQNQDGQNQDSEQNQDGQNQDPNQQNQPPPQQQPQQGQAPSMQPREAEALLDALEQKEKDLLREMKKEAKEQQNRKAKDW